MFLRIPNGLTLRRLWPQTLRPLWRSDCDFLQSQRQYLLVTHWLMIFQKSLATSTAKTHGTLVCYDFQSYLQYRTKSVFETTILKHWCTHLWKKECWLGKQVVPVDMEKIWKNLIIYIIIICSRILYYAYFKSTGQPDFWIINGRQVVYWLYIVCNYNMYSNYSITLEQFFPILHRIFF